MWGSGEVWGLNMQSKLAGKPRVYVLSADQYRLTKLDLTLKEES